MNRITFLEIRVFMKNGEEKEHSKTFEKQMSVEEVRQATNLLIANFNDLNCVILAQTDGHNIVIPMESINHYEIEFFEEDEVQL